MSPTFDGRIKIFDMKSDQGNDIFDLCVRNLPTVSHQLLRTLQAVRTPAGQK